MLIMGILNITTDSFSDGNKYINTKDAIAHAYKMIEDGADIIDIGAESTRPGAIPINAKTEIERLIPVIKELKNSITISVDTYKSDVARKALEAGADIINDIYALSYDNTMIDVIKEFPKSKIILMHMKGTPLTMQQNLVPEISDFSSVPKISDFLSQKINFCLNNNISLDRIIIDPGIGFGKTIEQNIQIIKNIEKFKGLQVKLLLGTSKKSFIQGLYKTENNNPEDRRIGTLATTAVAYLKNVDIIRVHDVKEHKQMISALEKIL